MVIRHRPSGTRHRIPQGSQCVPAAFMNYFLLGRRTPAVFNKLSSITAETCAVVRTGDNRANCRHGIVRARSVNCAYLSHVSNEAIRCWLGNMKVG
jgi:hypothetical protein